MHCALPLFLIAASLACSPATGSRQVCYVLDDHAGLESGVMARFNLLHCMSGDCYHIYVCRLQLLCVNCTQAKHEPSMVPGFLSSNQGSLEPAFAGALTNIHASAHRTNLPASMPASGTTSSNQPKALLLQQQQQSDHQQVQDPAATHDSSHTQHHRASHTGTGSAHKIALAGHALTFYGHQRTYDGHGLTISSQRRYVSYYAHLLACGLKAPPAQRVRVVQLRLVGLPPWLTQKAPGCTVAVWTRAPGSVESQLLACTHVGPNTPAAAAAASSTDCRRTEAQPQAGCLSQPSPHTRSAVADTSEGASGAAAKQGGLAGEAAPHQAGVAGERLPCIMLPRVLRVDGTVELSLAPFSAPSSSSTVISPGSIPAGKAQINSVGQDQQSCGIQGSGVEVAGDVKIQVFKGRVWPHSAAVFSGRSSMFLAWLNVGFLGEHMEHARHAVRPGAPPCGTTSEQEPGADAVKPEKSGASSGDAGAAAKPEDGAQIELRGSSVAPSLQTCQSGQTGQSGGLRAVVVHGGELDKVHKKLRRSCWAALRLEVVYAPLG